MKIIIYKSKRLLECISDENIILIAPVQLGFGASDGPKRREGDGRTPEGEYFISAKNPNSKFHLALGISYPGPADAAEGFRDGIIGKSDFDRICASPHRPPWDTPMGGFIMIHGQKSPPVQGDWTAGCIAVENSVMDALFPVISIGDSVSIRP